LRNSSKLRTGSRQNSEAQKPGHFDVPLANAFFQHRFERGQGLQVLVGT
jgi:hypothetical protein